MLISVSKARRQLTGLGSEAPDVYQAFLQGPVFCASSVPAGRGVALPQEMVNLVGSVQVRRMDELEQYLMLELSYVSAGSSLKSIAHQAK